MVQDTICDLGFTHDEVVTVVSVAVVKRAGGDGGGVSAATAEAGCVGEAGDDDSVFRSMPIIFKN